MKLFKYKCHKCGYEEERIDFVTAVDCPQCAGWMYQQTTFQEYQPQETEIITELKENDCADRLE